MLNIMIQESNYLKKVMSMDFFKVTFHKTNPQFMELINNLWIDLNYGINKIINLCDENDMILNPLIQKIHIFLQFFHHFHRINL